MEKLFLLAVLMVTLSSCGKRPDVDKKNEGTSSALVGEKAKEMISYGKQLYLQNGCHACHGLEGRGDGPASKTLDPPPRNYQDIDSYKQGASLEAITQTLFKGIPGTTMAPYPHIKEADRKALASYVIYLQKQGQ